MFSLHVELNEYHNFIEGDIEEIYIPHETCKNILTYW